VIGELDNFVENNEVLKQILEGSGGASTLVDAYIAMLACMTALLVSIPLINCINRLRTEEKRGRLEAIIVSSVSRKNIFGSFILIAVLESIVLTFFGAFGVFAAIPSTGLVAFGTLMSATFAYLPALFVMLALAVFLVGWFPKLTSLLWILFGYSFIMFYFGRLFADKIPEIVMRLSPFNSIPQLPVEKFSAIPFVVLCFIAIILSVIGIIGFEKRDIKN